MEEYQQFEFSNGLRLVYKQHPSPIAHCGFVIDVGSRDEQVQEMGMAHFIEHLFFKGTERRKSIHILNRLEFVGGELNAYTTKDKTCVYAAVGQGWFSRAAELLYDVVFHSVFPEKELEKEKKVIHEEIEMYLDSPEENIQDVFQEKAFNGNPLGFNILGTHQSLNSFDRSAVKEYYQRWYIPSKMVFVYNGPKSFRQVLQIVRPLFEKIPALPASEKRIWFDRSVYTPFRESTETRHTQTYLALGGWAYPSTDERRSHAALLMNILGGPGLNSRLMLAIREKYGYAYDVEASYQAMKDIGLFNVFIGTDGKYLKKIQDLIRREFERLRKVPFSSLQMHRYKNQFKGQIMMSEENRSGQALMYGKLLLDDRKIETLEEVFSRIDAIGPQDLMNCACDLFSEENVSQLIFEGGQ